MGTTGSQGLGGFSVRRDLNYRDNLMTLLQVLYIEDITRWRKDMNFIFEWQNIILRTSAVSE